MKLENENLKKWNFEKNEKNWKLKKRYFEKTKKWKFEKFKNRSFQFLKFRIFSNFRFSKFRFLNFQFFIFPNLHFYKFSIFKYSKIFLNFSRLGPDSNLVPDQNLDMKKSRLWTKSGLVPVMDNFGRSCLNCLIHCSNNRLNCWEFRKSFDWSISPVP